MIEPATSVAVPGDARTSLALWLRAGRAVRRLSLEDVARITKIQPRILERLEAGQADGLPAEVFVRGFVRSIARCVGLDETEALDRYGACAGLASARAFIETVGLPQPVQVAVAVAVDEPVPSEPIPAVIEVVEMAETPKKKRTPRRKAAGTTPPRPRKKKPTERTSTIEVAPVAPVAPVDVEASAPVGAESPVVVWQPTMPPLATVPSVPWRRARFAPPSIVAPPSLVIDDADPDRAERERAERDATSVSARQRSFLPPILLDREDRSARQGGLTLAVIILLIAATLTLSYLMRRPNATGDGVTMRHVPTSLG